MAQSFRYQCGRTMAFAMVPPRIRAAAAVMGLVGVGLFIYTVMLTIPLISDPDPMLGLELIVSAILVLGAAGSWGALGYSAHPAGHDRWRSA